ncbi:MAG: DUF1501 domain-containing protein [Polyangiaceae bacterium]
MNRKQGLSRRKLLATLGVGTGAFILRDLLVAPDAEAGPSEIGDAPRIIYCQIPGAWDTLLCLDPRDNTQFGAPGQKIQTGYDLVADNDAATAQVLANTGGTGLVKPNGSNIAFGPAIGRLANKYDKLCVVRGMSMGTLTHEVGRRYFLTGKFPRGLAASGSAVGTKIASLAPDLWPIPNLVSDVETYNEGLDPKASGLVVNRYSDLGIVLKSLAPALELSEASAKAVDDHHHRTTCIRESFAPGGLLAAHLASIEKARVLAQGTLFSHFDFIKNPPVGSEIDLAYKAFKIDPANPTTALNGAAGQALIAAQAITQNISQAVSIALTGSVDHHDDDWESLHAPTLRGAFDALADLITFLENTPLGDGSYLDKTILVCSSDFARTPGINARGGRDHHLYSSCVVAGAGIRGNTVIGATTDNYEGQAVDPDTGEVDAGGIVVRPPDVHATLFKALGLSYDHISNQDPVLLGAMLKS